MADTLKNKTVRLSEEQIAALNAEAIRDRRDFSQLVRIAVDELLESTKAARERSLPVVGTEVAS